MRRVLLRTFLICLLLLSVGITPCRAQDWQRALYEAFVVSQQGNSNPERRRQGQDSAIVLASRTLKLARSLEVGKEQAEGHILNVLGEFHFRESAFAAAESVWVEALAINSSLGQDAGEQVDASLFRLIVCLSQVGTLRAPPAAKVRVLALRDTLLQSTDPAISQRLFEYAMAQARLERLDSFYDLCERLVTLWEDHPDSDPRYAIRSLVYLAEHVSKPDFGNVGGPSKDQESSIGLAARALTLAEEYFGADDTLVAFVATRLGDYHARLGNTKECYALWEKASTINRRAFPPEHIEHQGSICRMADVYMATGRLADAEQLYRQAVILREKTQGPGHPETAGMYMNLGYMLQTLGKSAEAERCYRHALSIRESAIERIDSDVAQSLKYLGLLYYDNGWYSAAEEYLTKALEIREEALGPNHALVASCLCDLADLYETWGRSQEAEAMLQRALAVRRAFLGDRHPKCASSMKALASHYLARGDSRRARPLLEQAIAIVEEQSRPDDITFTQYQSELARLLYHEGDFEAAEELLLRVLKTKEALFGSHDHRLVPDLVALARIYTNQNRTVEAMAVHDRIQSLHQSVPVLNLPIFADSYEDHAQLCLEAGRRRQAIVLSEAAFRIRLQNLQDGAPVMAERDALAYGRSMRRSRDRFLSMFLSTPSPTPGDIRTAGDIILVSKGQVSDEVLERNRRMLGQSDPFLADLNDSLQYARSRLSRLFVKGPDARDAAVYQRDIELVSKDKRRLEAALARQSRVNHHEDRLGGISADAVRTGLPRKATLVEYLRFENHQSPLKIDAPHYLALVLASTEEIHIRDLGPAGPIDSLVTAYQGHLSTVAERTVPPDWRDLQEYRVIGKALRRAIWDPVASFLLDSGLVLIAPDAALNCVSFGGLVDENDSYLVESRPLHYLSSGRDLVRLQYPQKESGRGLFVLGDPDFDAPPEERQSLQQQFSETATDIKTPGLLRNVQPGCEGLNHVTFPRLLGSREEAKAIASLWRGTVGEPVMELFSAGASEENLKRHASGKRAIHLATHGFLASGQCTSDSSHDASIVEATYVGENPLLRSGLCFAGANLHGAGADMAGSEDGILTAEEVTGLDLHGTSWVVLSACESALGEIKPGEGVYGVRRAFQVAGARTVISALWKISDMSTLGTIRHLYSDTNLPLPIALRNAALRDLQELRERKQPDHPYNWGALIAIGDWRGLQE